MTMTVFELATALFLAFWMSYLSFLVLASFARAVRTEYRAALLREKLEEMQKTNDAVTAHQPNHEPEPLRG